MLVSVIIPVNKDPFVQQTVDSLLENSELGDQLEVIVVFDLDSYSPIVPLKNNPRIKILYSKGSGMKAAINTGLAKAEGKFVMKSDSHCLFDKGYDRILSENCAENWLMIPRRYSLDELNWKRNEARPKWDYHYLSFPQKSIYGCIMAVVGWPKRTPDEIDDTMTLQGSCWFANREYFMEKVGFLDDSLKTYGTFIGESHQIGLKYWLGGGEVKVIKKTWYAHLLKRKVHYDLDMFSPLYKNKEENVPYQNWISKHWMNNEEPNMIHPFSWLIEKFWPIPTWPENWKEIYDSTLRTSI